MKPDPKIFDDIARVAGGAVNIVSGLQQQVRDDIRARMDEMAAQMNLVPREDLDRALEMVTALRRRVDALEARLAKLEKGKPAAAPAKMKKPAAKKPAGKIKQGKKKP
jgi:BMFP domain-containing protein YqiC